MDPKKNSGVCAVENILVGIDACATGAKMNTGFLVIIMAYFSWLIFFSCVYMWLVSWWCHGFVLCVNVVLSCTGCKPVQVRLYFV